MDFKPVFVAGTPARHRAAQSSFLLASYFTHGSVYIGEGNGNPLQYSCLENPGTGEPGGLLSMGSHRVGHD